MQVQLRKFSGTCHKCREVGHLAYNCRRSVDLPKCSTKEVATIINCQMKTWEHNSCYNLKEKLSRGSGCKSVAIKRPTNALECIADGQGTNLLREVSNEEEKDLLNVPDGLHQPQDKP